MHDELRQQILDCTNCHLCTAFHGPVPGILNKRYGVLIVGEAPGHEEDMHKMPFVGPSGRYLRMKLHDVHLPTEYVSYANMVSCRPTLRRGKNRVPTPEELAACRNNILAQVAATQPRIVLTVGNVSSRLFYDNIRVKHDRGRPVWIADHRIQIPTWHPAFVMRKKEYEKDFEADLQQVRLRAYKGLKVNWPEDCRICRKPVDKYDAFGLAYCDEHYVDSIKPIRQFGMV